MFIRNTIRKLSWYNKKKEVQQAAMQGGLQLWVGKLFGRRNLTYYIKVIGNEQTIA